jgi:hypothetical protein
MTHFQQSKQRVARQINYHWHLTHYSLCYRLIHSSFDEKKNAPRLKINLFTPFHLAHHHTRDSFQLTENTKYPSDLMIFFVAFISAKE